MGKSSRRHRSRHSSPRRIGVKDTFGRSGTFDDLIKAYGMDAESVADTIEAALKK